MRFQNGIDIDPDQMTYEELLELEEKMGKVSKGISEEQFSQLNKFEAKGAEDVCSICYCSVKEGEELNLLPCSHYFHVDCLREWLLKEKVCPLCKQEVLF
jgi:E3 ubiquitin-protein ligase BIG BROTHER-like protein